MTPMTGTALPVRLAASRRVQAGLVLLPSCVLLAGLAAIALSSLGRALSPVEQGLAFGVALLPVVTPWLLRWRGVAWDPVLGGAVWMLCALGVITVARVTPVLLEKQLLWIVLGWGALLGTLAVPDLTERLRRYKYTWLWGGLALALVTLVFGQDLSGSGIRLWLQLGPVTVQPSELLRVLLVVFLAAYLDERRDLLSATSLPWGPLRLPPLPYLLPLLSMLGIILLILVFQHDLGPALLYFGTFLAMVYVTTGRRSYLLSGLGLFALAGAGGYALSGHIRNRFALWLDPWSDPQGQGYQSLQALEGLAFGGVAGRGPGYGYPTLIPAAHTDYPLAVIGEEWGLLGTLAVVVLYAVLTTRMLDLAAHLGRDRFGQLLGAGLGISLGLQAFIILGGVLRLVPLTGITSPFLSYGGSSMIMSFVALGLLLRLWTEQTRA
ncbi:MAG: FtsW/RodA/SpoVE family cell cycle protein [Chloroflexi bacterium]|nr:FtsW/RodA/SpoVE family cell cycle protein [Chloroflexota bacterium]